MSSRTSVLAETDDFYRRLKAKGAAPLWESLGDLVPDEPRPASVPMHWRYAELRPLLMEAGSRITASQAERRVLVLENPGIKGGNLITESLYAGLQLVLPGEIAPTHRHSASALRFIVEGTSGYTTVSGERAMMHPGDLILTPSWTFHDHGNLGGEPVVWLDGLDVPIVNMLNTGFIEHYHKESQPLTVATGDSLIRYGSNVLPVEHRSDILHSPVFTYPYERSRAVVTWLSQNDPINECHGFKVQYSNPLNGAYPLPTISPFLQLLP
ncbi:MAG TPA: cupin domain-containing protein, partial [Terriglobales bacterium]|nr:cupin domain-containing protein [Terriglobales bacterium]